MLRSYYSTDLPEFLRADSDSILNTIRRNDPFEFEPKQEKSWKRQIQILKDQLQDLGSGRIMFEYTIPRMGKRVDVVLLYADFVFVMEFKVNKDAYHQKDEDQCVDYAMDLKNFHQQSSCASIIPILVATDAKSVYKTSVSKCADGVYGIMHANKDGIISVIRRTSDESPGCPITAPDWEKSEYHPTPTITEAAMALCSKISGLEDITRSDAGTRNLGVTTCTLHRIIEKSKSQGNKSICFVTGVPGSGKTLAALNLVCSKLGKKDELPVMLSGNESLVDVLRESLKKGGECIDGYAGAGAASLIQHIPDFRQTLGKKPPPERIIVFDEAQRAWSAKQLSKKNKFNVSDPELLLQVMSKHKGWAVIVCLIGEGQEIYNGEVGLTGWFEALKNHPGWTAYHPKEIEASSYVDESASDMLGDLKHERCPELHLDTSIRSFRGEKFAMLVRSILECDADGARKTLEELPKYPIVITRDINKAKLWLKKKARGTERYGIVASSGGERLKPYAIFLNKEAMKKNRTQWFLAGKDDIRSSYHLENVMTEFYVQGLELDWACLAWDANLRYKDGRWAHHKFHGNKWTVIRKDKAQDYLVNSYRVLMTRARQGMVIFVPPGDADDATRNPEFYDGTYAYLKGIGLKELEDGDLLLDDS